MPCAPSISPTVTARSAAASRVAAARRAANPRHTGEESYNTFSTVNFPHHQMRILDYNRVVSGLNGMDAATFLERVRDNFSVQDSPMAVKPSRPGEFGLYVAGKRHAWPSVASWSWPATPWRATM